MAELTMANAEYARSKTGTEKIKSNLDKDIKNIKDALSGTAKDNMLKTFKSYWVGSDHDAFVKDLESKISSIKTRCNTIQKYIDQALTDDYNNFIKNQRSFYKK